MHNPSSNAADAGRQEESAFSPDGHWLAYQSNETGRAEVFARRYPELDAKEQVSRNGGFSPKWSADSTQVLYYEDPQIMTADWVRSGSAFHAGPPRPWLSASASLGRPVLDFDVHPDGKRLLIRTPADAPTAWQHVVLVLNFPDELRRLTAR